MMKNRQHFTLFELLIAIALLVMVTIVLLRMFLLSSTLWTASDEQARLYADAKTALSIISDDLNNIVYQDASDAAPPVKPGNNNITAPLWLEAYSLPAGSAIASYRSYGGNYTAGLHFVTRSNLGRNAKEQSGIFSVSYRFVPPSQNGGAWPKYANAEGALVRACVSDCESHYQFINRQPGTSMAQVFYPVDSSFKRVVTGVLDFQILAYQKVSEDDWDDAQYPAPLVASNGVKVHLIDSSHSGNGQSDLTGAKNIETIQIVLTIMVPERIPELRKLLNANDTQAVKEYLFKYSRTFRKTIRIRNHVADKEE